MQLFKSSMKHAFRTMAMILIVLGILSGLVVGIVLGQVAGGRDGFNFGIFLAYFLGLSIPCLITSFFMFAISEILIALEVISNNTAMASAAGEKKAANCADSVRQAEAATVVARSSGKVSDDSMVIREIPVDAYNVNDDFYAGSLVFTRKNDDVVRCSLIIENPNGSVKAVYAGIRCETEFGDELSFDDVLFSDFRNYQNRRYVSGGASVALTDAQVKLIKAANLDITRYSIDDRIVNVSSHDMKDRVEQKNQFFGDITLGDVMEYIEGAETAEDAVARCQRLYEDRGVTMEEDLQKTLKNCLQMNRLYGGGSKMVIDEIQRYFENR